MNIEKKAAGRSGLLLESNRADVAFLEAEIETALTFAQAALEAGNNSVKKSRNQANARKAYDTVMQARKGFPLAELTPVHREGLEDALIRLEATLEYLGETL